MAKLSKKDMEQIIKRDLPGYKLAGGTHRSEVDALWAPPEARSQDLDALRKRFLGDRESDAAAAGPEETDAPSGAGSDDDEDLEDAMVPIEPEGEPDPTDRRSHAKVAIVSGKDRKVVGTQG
jgi:hypothetical protein